MKNYNPQKHVRLMRYDFHPTVGGGWAVSEVNSDVPGGFAEASLMPQVAKEAIGGDYSSINFGEESNIDSEIKDEDLEKISIQNIISNEAINNFEQK